jgi:hypothetical protein
MASGLGAGLGGAFGAVLGSAAEAAANSAESAENLIGIDEVQRSLNRSRASVYRYTNTEQVGGQSGITDEEFFVTTDIDPSTLVLLAIAERPLR